MLSICTGLKFCCMVKDRKCWFRFSLFPHIVFKSLLSVFFLRVVKSRDCVVKSKRVQLFIKQQIFRQVEIESTCRGQNKCGWTIEICFAKGRKHCRNRRNYWLPVFSSFPIMFFKSLLFQGC